VPHDVNKLPTNSAEDPQFKATAARTAEDYYLPGLTAERNGDLDEAIRSYQAALRLQPNHFSSLYYLAVLFNTDKINRRPEAIAYFTACIALRADGDGLSNNAYGRRSWCYGDLGLWDDAIADARHVLRLHPNWSIPHSWLGHALWGKGRWDESIAEMREALRLDPGVFVNHHNLAWRLADCPDPRLRDPARAVEHARKAIELEPKASDPWWVLGLAYYRAGDWKASVAALEKTLELSNGGDAADWFFLAMAHWRLGHHDEARAWYDKAVAWKARNRPQDKNEELSRHRVEAEALLGLADLPADVFARP
jgi:tetratricopeptide (TPR) repeat protein